jgi:hypothetical protein
MCNPEIVLMVHTGRHQTCGEWSGRPEPMVVAGDCLRRRRIMAMTDLLLKSSGPVADQYKVLAGDQVVGHIRLSEAAPTATPWRWTLSYRHHKGGRTPTHGYGATCEAAVQAFAKSWRRESQSEERSLGIAPRASPRSAGETGRG